jgi:hypothetical protein
VVDPERVTGKIERPERPLVKEIAQKKTLPR